MITNKETDYLQSYYTVRFNDCDPLHHLNNGRYIDYMLNAREDHLKEHYQMDIADFIRKGSGWVVAQHEIIYKRPASLNEIVCIRSGILAADLESLVVEMLMLDQKQVQLKALLHTRFVPVNISTGRKEAHSAGFMEFLSDKILPGIPDVLPTAAERVSWWQQQLKLIPTN